MASRKSYTMLELATTIAVIAILAAIAVPNFLEAQIRAKTAQILTNQRLIAASLEAYYVDFKAYPSNLALADFKVTEKEEKRKVEHPMPAWAFIPGEQLPPGMSEPPPPTTTETVRIIDARWITSKQPPKDFSIHRSVLVCQLCGYYSPLQTNSCYRCGLKLDPANVTEVYSFSLDGSVLDVLSTPVPYLPQDVNVDIFARRHGFPRPAWSDRIPIPFCYVNFTQVKKDGLDIPAVPGKARYAIISLGPYLKLNFVNRYPTPSFVTYDPTNGTISPGDIITWHN